jgi:hypothetical protein
LCLKGVLPSINRLYNALWSCVMEMCPKSQTEIYSEWKCQKSMTF